MQRPARSAFRDQNRYGSFRAGEAEAATGLQGRESSVASRVTFSAQTSPTRLQHEEPETYGDYYASRYPTMQEFRQRMLLGIVSSLFLLVLIIILFSLFISGAASLVLTPIFLGAAAYLSSDALRHHFVYQLIDSDTLILVVHAILQECLRLPAVLLAIDHVAPADVLSQVAAVATGVAWGMAFAESLLRLWTLWQQIQLYLDVLPLYSAPAAPAATARPKSSSLSPRSLEDGDNITAFLRSDHPEAEGVGAPEEDMTDAFLDASVRERERMDLEDQLGMPLFALPSFLLPLWSFNSFILSTALSLIIATIPTSLPLNLIKALVVAWAIRIVVALGWAHGTSKYGLAAVSYASLLGYCALCLVALGAFGVIH